MEEKNGPLTIETPRAGWRPWTIFKLGFVIFWCVGWSWQGGGLGSPLVLIGVALGMWMLAMMVDHIYTTFRLAVTEGRVLVERRCVIRPRTWTCSLAEFRVGPIDVVDDGEGPGLGAHRYIDLHVGRDVIRFMEGHSEESLEAARARLSAWLACAKPAA